MKYLQHSFTLPVNCKRMTDEEYAERVGKVKPAKKGTTKDQQLTGKIEKTSDTF
jgi:hypothetical protein